MSATDIITLVDRADRPIGQKLRRNVTANDIYRVATLWVTNSAGDILLAKRSLTKSHNPGLWGPAVAGTVEVGETYESNIYKEAEEEIGLTAQTFQPGPHLLVHSGARRYMGQWFTCVLDRELTSFRLQQSEVAEVRWVPRTELIHELTTHPERYVPSATTWFELFLRS